MAEKKPDLWYNAPYREERTPSRSRSIRTGTCGSDFGLGRGGDIFTPLPESLYAARIFSHRRNYISEVAGGISSRFPLPTREGAASEPAFQEVEQENAALRRAERLSLGAGHPSEVAARHCRQVSYRVHGKSYLAIVPERVGRPNWAAGRLAGGIPPKDIVSRQGTPKTDACDVFEGFFDFLRRDADHPEELMRWCLHPVGNLAKSFRYLDGYKTIDCYLDNDEADERRQQSRASDTARTEP